MKPFARTDRIASEVREALAMLMLTEVGDPRVNQGLVTQVKVTPDMGLARVYVRALQGDEQGKRELLAGLKKCNGFLRRELARRVRLLRVPVLEFYYDDVPDTATRVEELLMRLPPPAKDGVDEPPVNDEPDEKPAR